MSNQWLADIERDILKGVESASQVVWFKTADVLLSEVKRLMLEVSMETYVSGRANYDPARSKNV